MAAFFHPKSLVESKRSVGDGTRVWAFAHVLKGASVGRDCNLCDHTFLESGAVIGDCVTLKNGVSVWDGVTLEDDVFVGPNAVFTNDLWPVSRKPAKCLATRVKKGACIGANATIVCGVTIGRYAFIGAGSTVTKNVPDHALYFGHPAVFKGFLCSCRKKLKFSKNISSCCGKRFQKSQGKVRLLSR